MRVVVDTNVLVSGLLSPFGAPGIIVGLIAAGRLELCYDARILTEYTDVLRRPVFPFEDEQIRALLAQIRAGGELCSCQPLANPLPDPDDEPFLGVALWSMAEFLVTGNLRHFAPACRQSVRVVSPREFLDAAFRET